jgi:hypothetical protein
MAAALLHFNVRDAEVFFMLGDEDEESTVEFADAEIVLSDGSRWSVTFATLDEIRNIMERWAQSGEYKSGAYFRVPDLVISSTPGLANMLVAVEDLIDQGLDGELPRLEEGDE